MQTRVRTDIKKLRIAFQCCDGAKNGSCIWCRNPHRISYQSREFVIEIQAADTEPRILLSQITFLSTFYPPFAPPPYTQNAQTREITFPEQF